MRIKIRHRSSTSLPWKWELYVGKRLVTASHESYATQADAAGRTAVDRVVLEAAAHDTLRNALTLCALNLWNGLISPHDDPRNPNWPAVLRYSGGLFRKLVTDK